MTARQAANAHQVELAAAQKQLDEFAPIIAQQESAAKVATDAQKAAADGLSAAKADCAKQVEAAQAIAGALTSAETARQKLPEDAVLTEVVTKLSARTVSHKPRVSSRSNESQFARPIIKQRTPPSLPHKKPWLPRLPSESVAKAPLPP